MRRILSLLTTTLLAVTVLAAPPLLTQRAEAQIIDSVSCSGGAWGAFCAFLTPDPLTCQDCVGGSCDLGCLDAEDFYYCIEDGFLVCDESF